MGENGRDGGDWMRKVLAASVLRMMPIDELLPDPNNGRGDLSPKSVRELMDGIRAAGMIDPIFAHQDGDVNRIIAGHRRKAAARFEGWAEVPVRFYPGPLTEGERLELNLADNRGRKDPDRMATARKCRKLVDLGYSYEQVGERVGMNKGTVCKLLKRLAEEEAAADSPAIAGKVGPSAGRRAKRRDPWESRPHKARDGYSVIVSGPSELGLDGQEEMVGLVKEKLHNDGRNKQRRAVG